MAGVDARARLGRVTPLGPLLSPILVGRDDLLEQADRRIAAAAGGRGQFLLLAGEGGIGKSRLIASIERTAQAAGFETSAGLLAPQDRDVPAASLLDLARTMRRQPRFADLGRELLALADAAVNAPQPGRRVLVLRAVDLIVAAVDAPVMLCFDDLQWADDLSLEILTELARATRDRPLLLVAAYRTDELTPGSILRQWRSRLLSQRMAEEARLAPLTREETAVMTTAILGLARPAPRDVVTAVHDRTDGVPLHVEELLGALAESDRTDSRAIRDAAVPETLEEAILQRVGRLSAEAQAVARSGSVIGRCFVPGVLAGMMDVPEEALDAPLRELVAHDVLEPPGVRGLYDFRHQLLRDALYRTVPAPDLRRMHARAAEFGGELEGASEVHASVHYERAGMPAQAFRSALSGARAAARLSAHQEAFDLYGRVVRHMPADLAPGEKAAILDAAADEAAAREQIPAWAAWAREARERYTEAGDAVGAAGMLLGPLTIARREADPLVERLAAIDAARVEVDGLPPTADARSVRSMLRLLEAVAALEALDLERARAAILASRADAIEAGHESLLLDTKSWQGGLDVVSGDVDDGLAAIESAAREARAGGFEETGVTAFRVAAVAAVGALDYRHAAAWIDEGLRYADAIEQSYCSGVMTATSGMVAWGDGRWDDAVVLGEQALATRGSARAPLMGRWPLAYVALGRGELAEARRHLAVATAYAERSGAPELILPALWGSAEVSLLAGEYAVAIELSDTALALATGSGERGWFAPFAVTGTRALLAASRPAEAAAWVRRVDGHLGSVEWVGSPAIDHARGLLALAEGSTGVARSSLEKAVAGWVARGRAWEELWARLDLAECLSRSGRFVEAGALATDVRESARRLGSHPLVDRSDVVLRLARGRGAVQEPWHPLTTRELEVARLIAAGMTNGEIATELGIAPRTASAHVEHILAKLGVARRAEIAAWVSTIGDAGRRRDEHPALGAAGGQRP